MVYHRAQQYSLAISDFDRVLVIKPDFQYASYYRKVAYKRMMASPLSANPKQQEDINEEERSDFQLTIPVTNHF